jgi:hypothetical protein
VIFLAGLAQAVVGFYQYIFRVGPEGFLLFGGGTLRVFGTFEQPNPFAGYLGLIIPLALGVILGILSDREMRLGHSPDARTRTGVVHALNGWARYALFGLAAVALGAMLEALYLSLALQTRRIIDPGRGGVDCADRAAWRDERRTGCGERAL